MSRPPTRFPIPLLFDIPAQEESVRISGWNIQQTLDGLGYYMVKSEIA